VEKELQQLLEGTVGLRVRRVGARFFWRVAVSSEADQKRIAHIAALYPGQVESWSSGIDRRPTGSSTSASTFTSSSSTETPAIRWAFPGPRASAATAFFTNAVTYDFVARAVTTATASITNQPLPALDIAARRGWAKVLETVKFCSPPAVELRFARCRLIDGGLLQNLAHPRRAAMSRAGKG